ncbi:hypothetical protein [Natrinema caseinilyticum]|uniref:hypothetical protein n=1 Tax=Natrinema caseinilyticum TaxID=2961570 RepID=UPI0020C26278|nr:hypothetical protein [Natrinema caseinilyticum]
MPNYYWNPAAETIAKADLHRLQAAELREQAMYVLENASIWQDRCAVADVDRAELAAIESAEDFRETVPILDKRQIRDRLSAVDPYGGTLCVDPPTAGFRSSTSGTRRVATTYAVRHTSPDKPFREVP